MFNQSAAQVVRRVKEAGYGSGPDDCVKHLASEVVVQAGRDALDFGRWGLFAPDGTPKPWPKSQSGRARVISGCRDQLAHVYVRKFFLEGEAQEWLDLSDTPLEATELWAGIMETFPR